MIKDRRLLVHYLPNKDLPLSNPYTWLTLCDLNVGGRGHNSISVFDMSLMKITCPKCKTRLLDK